MVLRADDLSYELRKKLGIQTEPSVGQSGNRHVALGKVLKALHRLDDEDRTWVLDAARKVVDKESGAAADVLTNANTSSETIPADLAVELVAREFGVPVSQLRSKSRVLELVEARQVAMYVLYMTSQYTLSEIGDVLGGRTPATISYGFQKVAQKVRAAESIALKVSKIMVKLC